MQTGLTQKVIIPFDSQTHRLKDLMSVQEGHRPYCMTIVNPSTDPSGTGSANTVYAGAEGNPDLPLAVGASKNWFYIDPAKFAISQKATGTSTSVTFVIVDWSGCDHECDRCRESG